MLSVILLHQKPTRDNFQYFNAQFKSISLTICHRQLYVIEIRRMYKITILQ